MRLRIFVWVLLLLGTVMTGVLMEGSAAWMSARLAVAGPRCEACK
jgi:hypothetical protein